MKTKTKTQRESVCVGPIKDVAPTFATVSFGVLISLSVLILHFVILRCVGVYEAYVGLCRDRPMNGTKNGTYLMRHVGSSFPTDVSHCRFSRQIRGPLGLY